MCCPPQQRQSHALLWFSVLISCCVQRCWFWPFKTSGGVLNAENALIPHLRGLWTPTKIIKPIDHLAPGGDRRLLGRDPEGFWPVGRGSINWVDTADII
jgi:hypothetical protein